MPELMPFGKYQDSSVEQIVLRDYHYFDYVIREIPLRKPSLRERFQFVEYVVNNFISQQPCGLEGCVKPAELVSVYSNWSANYRGSSKGFIYCSPACFNQDSKVTDESNKVSLEPIRFRTALSSTKADTNELIQLFAWCLGLKEGRKSKEYLEEFFNKVKVKPKPQPPTQNPQYSLF